jgi:hypothetical protein
VIAAAQGRHDDLPPLPVGAPVAPAGGSAAEGPLIASRGQQGC